MKHLMIIISILMLAWGLIIFQRYRQSKIEIANMKKVRMVDSLTIDIISSDLEKCQQNRYEENVSVRYKDSLMYQEKLIKEFQALRIKRIAFFMPLRQGLIKEKN